MLYLLPHMCMQGLYKKCIIGRTNLIYECFYWSKALPMDCFFLDFEILNKISTEHSSFFFLSFWLNSLIIFRSCQIYWSHCGHIQKEYVASWFCELHFFFLFEDCSIRCPITDSSNFWEFSMLCLVERAGSWILVA